MGLSGARRSRTCKREVTVKETIKCRQPTTQINKYIHDKKKVRRMGGEQNIITAVHNTGLLTSSKHFNSRDLRAEDSGSAPAPMNKL